MQNTRRNDRQTEILRAEMNGKVAIIVILYALYL